MKHLAAILLGIVISALVAIFLISALRMELLVLALALISGTVGAMVAVVVEAD